MARKLNKSNKELLAVLQQLDIPVKSHSSSIDEETAKIVENILNESKPKSKPSDRQHKQEHDRRNNGQHQNNNGQHQNNGNSQHQNNGNSQHQNNGNSQHQNNGNGQPQKHSNSQPQKPQSHVQPPKLTERPPIITVMGHVDHGKTTLLDNIRHSSIAAHEAGGITQHIGAYVVKQDGKEIVFLDTPGHEAFTEMRARGASVTDIVILVIGADDGVMPQTREAIDHIKAAGVPLVVAINKIDKQGAKPDRVRQQLSELGIFTEGWGGEVGAVEISAKQGIGVADLLERVLLEAEMQELKGNPDANPEGVVIEARLDKGKGPVATVIVKDGTLKAGDIVLFGSTWGKIRALFDWAGKGLKKAGPSTPVEILGLDGVPNPGEAFRVVKTEREARDAIAAAKSAERDSSAEVRKASFEDLYSNLEEGQLPHMNLVVKCDVQGSLEALCASLEKLGNNEVGVSIVHRGVGRIAESDVMLASASNAVIVGFNVRPDGNAKRVAELNGVEIRIYSVIYDVLDDVKSAMAGLLKPVLREDTLGEVEVRKLFRVPKVGTIAGSHVTRGLVRRSAKVRVIRDGVVIWDGKIASLRHEKDEARELRAGNDCGISLEGFQDFREGDILEAYEVIEEKRTL
ncbi:MAG: translation initiation factor IF-2 [Synergistaceae bacterium]|nr:translation initiation factor IF-2 [Synergistaceae bacterium]